MILALLVASAPDEVLADYGARKSEAMSELDKATMTDAERAALEKALETYFGGREDCFEGLIAVVAKTDEAAQQATFRDRAAVCAIGASQVLDRALDDIDDVSIGALGFSSVFSMQEATFYQGLIGIGVADARDQIVTIQVRLAHMTDALDAKWLRLKQDDEQFDAKAAALTAEIREDYAKVLREAAEAHADTAELLAEQVKKLAESELSDISTGNVTVDTIVSGVKSALGPLITQWQAVNSRMGVRANAYRALFASELRVLVVFEDVREDVRDFLEDNDWPKADAAYALARTGLDAFVSAARTSGQSSDASELRGDLLEQLAIHLKRGADVYATFVSRNRGRFEGALGPDIEEQLVEHAAWEQYARYIEGYGLDTKLRDWHQHGTNYFNVSLDPLKSETREKLKVGLRAAIEQLLRELKTAEGAARTIEQLVKEGRDAVAEALD